MSERLFELYDRKRLKLLRMPAAAFGACPSEAAFLHWLKSRGAPADSYVHGIGRNFDDPEDAPLIVRLWSSQFEPVPEGELIPEWVPED